MLGYFLPELIKLEVILSGQEFEFQNTMMNGPLFGTYRAVAFTHNQQVSFGLETDSPAMTASDIV